MPHVTLADTPVVATPYGRWQRLNAPLGIEAFGVNAIVCEPGERFDIEHDEAEGGQQEAYVVVAGHAAFRVGDEEVDAPAGTVVSVPDPRTVRSFRAVDGETRIVCIGGYPGGERPGYGDWILEAAGELSPDTP